MAAQKHLSLLIR